MPLPLPGQIQGEATVSSGKWSPVRYRGVFGTISTIVRTEGPKSLYSGLVAGLQRQMSFASVRIGLYDSVKQFYTSGSERKSQYCVLFCFDLVLPQCLVGVEFLMIVQTSTSDVGVTPRLLAGCTTGAMAVILAQPTDVVKVRLQAQTKGQGCAKRYSGTLHAYKTIAKEEGINGLWKGRLRPT